MNSRSLLKLLKFLAEGHYIYVKKDLVISDDAIYNSGAPYTVAVQIKNKPGFFKSSDLGSGHYYFKKYELITLLRYKKLID